jgi:translation initiation factor 3 subunit L
MLGYFSLVGLLRLHCLLGDYYQALRVMENIELNKKGLYSRVPACQVSVFYYVGFCYMMMGRYQDAVRTFSNILYYIVRTQVNHSKNQGYSMINKKKDQLFHLLAIVMTLCPQRIDETVHAELLVRCEERMKRMGKRDDKALEELFSGGCPKFITSTAHNYADRQNRNMEPFKLQLKIFMTEIKQSLELPLIRSYLKLYSTMPIEKLAQFCDQDDENDTESFRRHLHQYKHKTTQLAWSEGTALEGERVPTADVDFYISKESNKDMIHIADVKIERNFGEHFMHSIYKLSNEGL